MRGRERANFQRFCPRLPTPSGQSPEAAKDNDAGHVQGPAGKFILSHLGFAHGVEEELEIPGCAASAQSK